MQAGWAAARRLHRQAHLDVRGAPDGTADLQSEAGDPVPATAGRSRSAPVDRDIGAATAGPTCPVETIGDPAWPRPVADATIIVRDGAGTEVARGTTRPDGAFFIAVAAGDYTVSGSPSKG